MKSSKIRFFNLLTKGMIFAVLLLSACQKDNGLLQGPDLAELKLDASRQVKEDVVKSCMMILPENDVSGDKRQKAASNRASFWTIGQNIRVRFIGGSPYVRAKVREYARVWEAYANINFVFVNSGDAEIRVAFEEGGSYSYVGTDALLIPDSEQTMNFGWFDDETSDTEFRRTTLHEFGHALGLKHEHQHPQNGIQWDRDAVYDYYTGPPNDWTREQVDRNIFEALSVSNTHFCMYDAHSIMHYSIPDRFTLNNFSVGWNTELSDEDKGYIGRIYPFSGARQERKCGEGLAGYDFLSAQDQVLSFDFNNDNREDLFFYRPGRGAAWVVRSNGDGTFTRVYGWRGIAGYDLLSPQDRVLKLDYNNDGLDDLFLYRPGQGAAYVARSNGDGTFTRVYGRRGIAGYDFLNPQDRALVLDYNNDGRDDLFFYRPGHGAAYVARSNGDGTFTRVYGQRGIAGYDFLSAEDRALVFDYNRDGRDDLFFYRPGHGAAYVARSNGNGTFTKVYGQRGIAGYDFLGTQDRALALDYNRDGIDDLFFYRPGRGPAYLGRSNGDATFTKVYGQKGMEGFDLLGNEDRAVVFDYNRDGRDDLFFYRPGGGIAWVVRSNGDGSFTKVN